MHFIEYKTRNLKGAYLYLPKNQNGIIPLVIWLTGGNDGAQLPTKFSLGKYITEEKLKPDCAVLCPASSYGHNYTTMTKTELWNLIDLSAKQDGIKHFSSIGICGWSLGADATANLTYESPEIFDRICLISNWPNAWKNYPERIDKPVKILVGKNEKSSKRDWESLVAKLPDATIERISNYGHNIGENIWLDKNYDLLCWLAGKN